MVAGGGDVVGQGEQAGARGGVQRGPVVEADFAHRSSGASNCLDLSVCVAGVGVEQERLLFGKEITGGGPGCRDQTGEDAEIDEMAR